MAGFDGRNREQPASQGQCDQEHGVARYQRDDLCVAGAQGFADADFPHPLGHTQGEGAG